MTRPLLISSASNDRLKAVRRLRRRPQLDRSVFVVEGHRQLRAALDARAGVREVYAAPDLYLGEEDATLVRLAQRRGTRVVRLTRPAFESISGEGRPDGLLAVVGRWSTALGELRVGSRPLLLAAEGLERPGNLGTVIRTTCAAGASGLLVCDARTDVFHAATVRGSVGTLFRLPIAEASTDVALRWLAERAIRVVVATPGAARAYWEADYAGAVAIVVGNERYGVTRAWLDAADEAVAIPMAGPADSLNVAVAAGVVLLEAARQRGCRPRVRSGRA